MDMEQLYSYVPRELVTFVLVTLFSFLSSTYKCNFLGADNKQ